VTTSAGTDDSLQVALSEATPVLVDGNSSTRATGTSSSRTQTTNSRGIGFDQCRFLLAFKIIIIKKRRIGEVNFQQVHA
jgi:hypothetical protein